MNKPGCFPSHTSLPRPPPPAPRPPSQKVRGNQTTKGAPNGFKGTHMITITMKDPIGSVPLAIDIRGVTSNRAATRCDLPRSCKQQGPTGKAGAPACGCLPDVSIMPGGQAWVMPQAYLPDLRPTGRIFRFAFVATHPVTNAACAGSADLCFIAGGGGRKPPACAEWGSSNVERNATTC